MKIFVALCMYDIKNQDCKLMSDSDRLVEEKNAHQSHTRNFFFKFSVRSGQDQDRARQDRQSGPCPEDWITVKKKFERSNSGRVPVYGTKFV